MLFKKIIKYSTINMVMKMYTPLYIKTHNSLLQSLITIDDLIDFAKKNNFKSLTITDNNMYGVMEFYNKCVKNDIKPIVGLEINDLVLYAMNYQGYQNLIKITTISSEREITLEDLIKYSSDLICITLYKSRNRYLELSKHFKHIYQGYSNLDEKRELTGNLIYINEVLYLEEKDRDYLRYLYAINKGVGLNEITLDKHDNHILAYKLYSDENNQELTDLCNLEMKYHQDLLPIYDCPNNLTSYDYLKQLIKIRLKSIFGSNIPKIYADRLKYELDVINKMGFCNYFLVVWDYVNYAKENGILNCCRGSAAGSLVSYVLGITAIDPIKYNLIFERFLNPDRISMPDIDIDFEYNRREEIINYCINKYGNKRAVPIITFGTLGAKQAIRDAARVMKIDLKIVDRICKLIDPSIDLKENLKNLKIKELLTDELKIMYKVAAKLEGLKRHTSIHAAGIIISNVDLDEVIPLQLNHSGFYTTGYSAEYLEELGLLKMDILALKNLTLLNDVLKETNINIDEIPFNDAKTIKLFTDVDTVGIFQFESAGMMNFLQKLKPTSFDDIIAAIALFRPGPMQNIDLYIKRKQGSVPIDYLDDSLVSILKPTYGVIIYQEQIMQIARTFASYTYAEADVLRKAMSKKKEDVLLKEKDKFISQSVANGHSLELANRVYDLILKFASYGFNKAHSVSYSRIAYIMAYLKAHYPLVFIKHLLNSVIGSEVKTKEYIMSAKSHGLNINKPDINKSGLTYIICNNELYFPFTNIKNVGENTAKEIVNKQPFKDIFDFMSRMNVSKSLFEVLIKADCFRTFNINQKTLDENIDALVNYSELGSLLNEDELKPVLTDYPEYESNILMNRELEVFGLYLANHPLSKYSEKYPLRIKDIAKYFNKTIDIAIIVDKTKTVITKKNDKMLFITGSDFEDTLDFILFPKMYREDIERGQIYLVTGKVEKRFDKYQVIVNNLQRLN